MPQIQLPFFPEGLSYINSNIGVKTEDDMVCYFNGSMNIYEHHKDDIKSFRYIISQMIVLGNARQVEIRDVFNVSIEGVKRSAKIYREEGIQGFLVNRRVVKKPRLLKGQMIIDAQSMLNALKTPREIEGSLGIKQDTLRKAIRDGRLKRPEGKLPESNNELPGIKSSRSLTDSQASMGVATTNTSGRIAAAVKKK
jgi:hypothetical protein